MKDYRHLLVTSSTFPLKMGDSIPGFVFNLANGLTPHFDSVQALTPGDKTALAQETMKDVTVHRYNYAWPKESQVLCYRHGMVANIKKHPLSILLLPQFVCSQISAIRKLCKTGPVDIVNSHWLVFQGFAGAVARHKCNYRHVIHVHAAGLYVLMRLPGKFGRFIARFIIRRSDHVICESTYVREKLDALLDWPSNASISCMGVDFNSFKSEHKEIKTPSILFVGRLVEKKGVKYLLKAIKILQNNIPDVTLDIVGSGPEESNLKKLAEQLQLQESCVHFLGSKPHEEIIALQKHARVITVPSIVDSSGETEGMPTVILEAMAAGKRVVASRVNGTPDVVKHLENGWLCNPKDEHDLANKLMDAIRSQDNAIIKKAEETAEFYNWPNLCLRYANYLRQPQ
ncbi:glycosyltransferase [Verrucomicrobiota bacterium]